METIVAVCHTSRMSKPAKAEMLATIRRARGSLRRKPGDQPLAALWSEHKAEEKALEERKLARHFPSQPG